MNFSEERLTERVCSRLQGWEVQREWYVVEGKTHFGQGDILARKGDSILAIECKFINSKNRTKKRKKVKDQALIYASFAKLKNPSSRVKGCWVTNEGRGFTDILSLEKASRVCANYLWRSLLWWKIGSRDRERLAPFLSGIQTDTSLSKGCAVLS